MAESESRCRKCRRVISGAVGALGLCTACVLPVAGAVASPPASAAATVVYISAPSPYGKVPLYTTLEEAQLLPGAANRFDDLDQPEVGGTGWTTGSGIVGTASVNVRPGVLPRGWTGAGAFPSTARAWPSPAPGLPDPAFGWLA
jgi:hypothetical protein